MFSDMDLIGVPHRIVLSERGLGAQQFEYKGRSEQDAQDMPLDKLTSLIDKLGSAPCATVD
jgi:prolyl-tRNA synthetase